MALQFPLFPPPSSLPAPIFPRIPPKIPRTSPSMKELYGLNAVTNRPWSFAWVTRFDLWVFVSMKTVDSCGFLGWVGPGDGTSVRRAGGGAKPPGCPPSHPRAPVLVDAQRAGGADNDERRPRPREPHVLRRKATRNTQTCDQHMPGYHTPHASRALEEWGAFG